jgi:hypothetical protein
MIYRTPLRRLFEALADQDVLRTNPARALPEAANLERRQGDPAVASDEAPVTLTDLKAFLDDLDHIGDCSKYFRPGLVAMYPLVVGGMDTEQIAAFTGIPPAEVEEYAGRLRENGIWTPDAKVVVDFDDPASTEAIVNLVLIVGCAAGVFRRFAEDGGSGWQAPEAGADAPNQPIQAD